MNIHTTVTKELLYLDLFLKSPDSRPYLLPDVTRNKISAEISHDFYNTPHLTNYPTTPLLFNLPHLHSEYLYKNKNNLAFFYFHHHFALPTFSRAYPPYIPSRENFTTVPDYFISNKNKQDSAVLLLFFNIKYSHFSNFFLNNQVDTPMCFLKTVSNKRNAAKFDLFKMVNFLFLSGKKEKIVKIFVKTLNYFYLHQKSPLLNDNVSDVSLISGNYSLSWLYFYTHLVTFSKLEKLHSTTHFGLNADEQRATEAAMGERKKKFLKILC